MQCNYYLFKTAYCQGVSLQLFLPILWEISWKMNPHPSAPVDNPGVGALSPISASVCRLKLQMHHCGTRIKSNKTHYLTQDVNTVLRKWKTFATGSHAVSQKRSLNTDQYFEDTVEFKEVTSCICMHSLFCPIPPNWVFTTSSKPIETRHFVSNRCLLHLTANCHIFFTKTLTILFQKHGPCFAMFTAVVMLLPASLLLTVTIKWTY